LNALRNPGFFVSSLEQYQRFEWQGVAAHQERLARDRYTAIDLLEAGLGINADCARIAWIGVGDDPRRAGLEQTLNEEADEGRVARPINCSSPMN
jgi:hypothetical protein